MRLVLLLTLALPMSSAAKYEIPEDRSTTGMQSVVEQAIPDELNKANCGFRVTGTAENSTITKVYGLPLRPETWRGESTGSDSSSNPYPETTSGLVFSNYGWHEVCRAVRALDPPCRNPEECQNFCADVNAGMRYSVYRHTCTVYRWNTTGTACEAKEEAAVPPDCNSTCSPSDAGCTDSSLTGYALVGEKYQCTGDWDEEHDKVNVNGVTGSLLRADFGWVWKDGKPTVVFPSEACKQFWTKGEDREHRNCMPCVGEQCRTVCLRGDCTTSSDDNNGRKLRTPFDPPKDLYGDSRFYDAFYRRYVGKHDLVKIPKTDAPEEKNVDDMKVKLACYNWYREKTLDPRWGSDLTCIADDLQLEKLAKRTVNDPAVQWNLQDSSSSLSFSPSSSASSHASDSGGFTLDPDGLTRNPQQPKSTSRFAGPALPTVKPVPPFGETPKYVTVLQQLERQMEDFPPTVDLLLPLTRVQNELQQLFQTAGSEGIAERTSSGVTNITIPLRAGLLDTVREVMRQAIFSRTEEDVVPVVVPLLSESELQVMSEAWQGWKQQRQILNYPTGNVDALLTKLGQYRDQVRAFRTLRAALPQTLAVVLERREQLSDAIDAWVASRMAPYEALVKEEDKKRELLAAWKTLQEAAVKVRNVNTPFCKADRTTPPLRVDEVDPPIDWIELEKEFPLPEVPAHPRSLVFDFTDIFYEGLAQAAALHIPVLEPVQVAINLPPPAPPYVKDSLPPTLPDLPAVPPLPQVAAASLTIEPRYSPEPPGSPIPYDDLARAFRERADDLLALLDNYTNLIWVKDPHPDLACVEFGKDGCVYPETMLWKIFMRIWAPVGAFVDLAENPPGTASSLSSASSCASAKIADLDQCLLREKLIRRGLRITLPKEATGGNTSSLTQLRRDMREWTILPDGSLQSPTPPYDITDPRDLYDVFPIPDVVHLERQNASASSSSFSST